MSFSVGETVGPYGIIEQLGQGSMATVHKAYHAALDRYVVLKALHPAFLEEQNFLARFQREARLLQAEFNAKQGQTDSVRNLLTAYWMIKPSWTGTAPRPASYFPSYPRSGRCGYPL